MDSYYFYEDSKVLSYIVKKDATILDVRCEEGRYIIPSPKEGHHCVGVDINPILMTKLIREMGLDIYTPADLDCSNDSFDYVIISHIIEHISPAQFILFMDNYISKLKIEGKLIAYTNDIYHYFNSFNSRQNLLDISKNEHFEYFWPKFNLQLGVYVCNQFCSINRETADWLQGAFMG